MVDAIKLFNTNCKDYFVCRTEENGNNVQRCLQILGASSDPNLYDPGNRDVIEFFINLHELLTNIEPRSHLNWLAVNVLLESCQNVKTRENLVNTYNFTPILTNILVSQPCEKRQKILILLKELTYGIKITWQEAYLTSLIKTLTNWITSDDSELLSLSLSVLVNLCYQNMPSLYTLLRTVNIKKFLKKILKIQQQYDSSRVEISKLLIILEGVSGGLPDQEIYSFIRTTFPSIAESLQTGNYFTMRHQVNFFKETINNQRTNQILQSYPNFKADMECLIIMLKDDKMINQNCLALLFEFMSSLITLENIDLELYFPCLINFALKWIRTSLVSTDALSLLYNIINKLFKKNEIDRDSEQRQEVIQKVFEALEDQFSVIMLLMDVSDNELGKLEMYSKLTALLNLLTEMTSIPKFADKILNSVSNDLICRLFIPLKQQDGLFQEPVYSFYVQALLFLSILADKEASWLLTYSEMLQEKQLQLVLSIALYTGPEIIKQKVLSLIWTTGFSAKCLNALASSMTNVSNLVVFNPNKDVKNDADCGLRQIDLVPLLSGTQEGYLNNLLEKYEKTNENQNIMTSSVIELYQYKITAMNQTLRHMHSSQEAADKRVTNLQHHLARTSSEVSKLLSMLHTNQQSLEASMAESKKLLAQNDEIQHQANETHRQYKELLQTSRSKTRIISEKENECKELNNIIQQKDQEIENLSKALSDEKLKSQELNENLAGLNKVKMDLETTLEKTKKELETKDVKLKDIEKELIKQHNATNKLENDVLKKTEEINDMKKALQEERRVREIISELAIGKGKSENNL